MENDIEKYKNDLKELLENHKRQNSQDEQFNVFTTLRKESDEVYLHSRFISSILDPEGNHGLGDKPLKYFLEIIGNKKFNLTKKTEVIPNSKDWTERKEIDIFIGNLELKGEKCAIIIENKIYATDGDRQLERYFDKVTKEFGYKSSNIEIYYLTLNGHKPSQGSIGNINVEDIHCIKYNAEIKTWLDEVYKTPCAGIFLKSTIEQYLALVTKLTCDVEYNNKLTDFVRKNWKKTKDIVLNEQNKYPEKEYKILREDFNHAYWHIIKDFLNDLGVKLNEMLIANGYEKSYSERQMHEWVTEIVHTHKRDIPLHYLFKDKNGICWSLQADSHNGKGFFIGVEKKYRNEKLDFSDSSIPYGRENNEDDNWRYRKYFSDEIKIDLWDCRDKKTKGTKTIEIILNKKDSIIDKYAEFVKNDLEKFGTKK